MIEISREFISPPYWLVRHAGRYQRNHPLTLYETGLQAFRPIKIRSYKKRRISPENNYRQALSSTQKIKALLFIKQFFLQEMNR